MNYGAMRNTNDTQSLAITAVRGVSYLVWLGRKQNARELPVLSDPFRMGIS